MTSRDRILALLNHEEPDRIGIHDSPWRTTVERWRKEGLPEGKSPADHFGYELRGNSADTTLQLPVETKEDTDEYTITTTGDGAIRRNWKHQMSTPELVGFTITTKKEWEEMAKPKLEAERRRIDFEGYREAKKQARSENRFFCCTGMHVFEIMKNVAGHEHMLVGMALEPDWVEDMVMTYSQMYVDMQEMLFAEEGYPDGIWYYEDMGFKQRPFMSPEMYMELVQPGHRLSFQFAHSKNLPVIVHSCGFVEALVPGLIDAGMDCLQVIEIKAGMDLLRLFREYGDKISLMGGIDVRVLYTNDREKILRELEEKIPVVKGNYGYMLHSDHSIPNTVDYGSYRYFIEKAIELGTYT